MKTILLMMLLGMGLPLLAQFPEQPTTGSAPMKRQDRTVLQGQVATTLDFGVRLVDVKQDTAVVQASVDDFDLVAPGGNPANEHQGHIVYKVDNGAEQTTTAKRFEVNGLSPGEHVVTVYLAGNDGREISPEHRLKIVVGR